MPPVDIKAYYERVAYLVEWRKLLREERYITIHEQQDLLYHVTRLIETIDDLIDNHKNDTIKPV